MIDMSELTESVKGYIEGLQDVLQRKYQISEDKALNMITSSYIMDSLIDYPEETLHDDIEAHADNIYEDQVSKTERLLLEAGYEGTIFFTNPSYEDAFLGISSDDRAIYDYEKMVESLVNHEDMTEDEAREFIDYNATFYIEGEPIMIYKDPKTDTSHLKKSHKGCCCIYYDDNGELQCEDGYNDVFRDGALSTVFVDGKACNKETFEDIRERLNGGNKDE